MSCVTTVSFSIVLNGNPGNFFYPSRGLRQGDPLSPYLFLLVSEVLSLRLTKEVSDGNILGVKLARSCPPISHLLFADDSLFFLRATLKNCQQLSLLFSDFCSTSGQMINYGKSSIYFSPNTPLQMQLLMCSLLNIVVAENPGKYLGLPTFWGRSKSQALGYIKDRISGKISGWKEKSLSQAGKTVLIKAVALAVPAFPMTCFKFPKNVCDDINSALGNFWWGSVDGKNKTHWRSWSHLCKSKEEGGLGFRDLHHFNLALLAKQAWRLIENPESTWARVLKARYFPKVGFSDAKKGYRASWGWSSLLEARDFVTKMGCWHVINGSSINLWKDQWLPPPNIGCIQTIAPIPDDAPTLVSDLIDKESRSWNLDTILHLLNPIDVNRILSIPIGPGIGLDRLIWPLSKNGKYSVSSGYHWVHSHLTTGSSSSISNTSHIISAKCWKMLWGLKTLPKIKCFLWKCLNGAVASFPNLFHRKLSQSPICPLCGAFDESIEHILLLCHWVDPIWYGSPLCLRIDKRKVTTLDKWLQDSIMKHSTESDRVWCGTLISFICWSIWKARCCFVYQYESPSPICVLQKGIMSAFEFINSCSKENVKTKSNGVLKWTHPPEGVTAINCDAAWSDENNGGLGVALRNHEGVCIGGAHGQASLSSVEAAEATTILLGVNVALDMGLKDVIVQSDSLSIITELNSSSSCKNWKITQIIDDIKWKKEFFNSITWDWIPREANQVADAAALLGKRMMGLNRWVNRPPSSLLSVLRNDGLPCPPLVAV